ncbi:MAG: phosphotransferase [Polyangiaceae bacterium]|nr:phosphotransferase [Polyangiaceae bacterium]
MKQDDADRRHALQGMLEALWPGARLLKVSRFGVDEGSDDAETTKGLGYGKPLLLDVGLVGGEERRLVFHTAAPNAFGHDRRSDRALEMLLAYDTFGLVPHHAGACDVGAIATSGDALVSLRDTGEFYLLSDFVPGHVYADELRNIAARGSLEARDRLLVERLVDTLIDIHGEKIDAPVAYQRAIRDLVGSGEGIFGIIDGFPRDGQVRAERLQRIEQAAVAWRWRLKTGESRNRRTHGDFHPFNIIIDESDSPRLLDTSRGSVGDPADDVSCLAINFVFFALGHRGAWKGALRELWYGFWERYQERSGDAQLLDVVAPFLAWRGLVLANPAWYPGLDPAHRDALLSLVEQALAAPRFDPAFAEGVFMEHP